MRIPRIYHPDLLSVEQSLSLTADAANHIGNVLRLKSGQPLVLFNGDGNEYPATLIEVSKRHVRVTVDAKLSISCESPLSIHLGQAVSKGERMEFVLQKSVELGVTEITPLTSERSVVKLSEERWAKKHEQWQKIIASACEQCGRNRLPTLHPVTSLASWAQQSTQQMRLTLDPRAERKLAQLSVPKEGLRLLIGPEGGLSEHEVYHAQQQGFIGIQLGPRILRTETAALTAIAALQSHFGDL